MVTDLCSIGTLFAFVLVCAGVLSCRIKRIFQEENLKHHVNSKCHSFMLAGLYYAFNFNNKGTMDFLTNETQINSATAIITSLNKEESKSI
jgi:amino acid transporter